MDGFERQIAITGGAGFIGSNLLQYLVEKYPNELFVNIDCLTYAGNLHNLVSLESCPNYRLERIDICDSGALADCFAKYHFSGVIHLAAESHVDRAILGPSPFIQTNVVGTFNLLEMVRHAADAGQRIRFHHVSTDEVFGSLGPDGRFTSESPYRPNSPYSATKAASDHLVRAYHQTYGIDVVTTNCSNNYGPYQFPEKMIPLMIHNARAGLPLPVYGNGKNVRDWLYVADHCEAIDLVFRKGESGQVYLVGGNSEVENITLVRTICRLVQEEIGGKSLEHLITFVADRPGHDLRYAIDASRMKSELGWESKRSFEKGLSDTVHWYLENESWMESCRSGQYLKYYQENYEGR
ncbi:MAG: dTDP-glucose 4,6-dehydratase [Candidatus Zixiibacteriota bacterium]